MKVFYRLRLVLPAEVLRSFLVLGADAGTVRHRELVAEGWREDCAAVVRFRRGRRPWVFDGKRRLASTAAGVMVPCVFEFEGGD